MHIYDNMPVQHNMQESLYGNHVEFGVFDLRILFPFGWEKDY